MLEKPPAEDTLPIDFPKSPATLSTLPTTTNAMKHRTRRVPHCGLIIAAIFVGLALFIIGQPIFTLLRWMERTKFYNYPPPEMFVATKQREPTSSDVVRPLVGLHDRFDIAVSVWQETSTRERINLFPVVAHGERSNRTANDWDNFFEKAIFSDVVFRGVKLSDTEIHTNISFTIPTEIFHNYPGNTGPLLRASFVLLPLHPSPIDYHTNHTSWYPSGLKRPRLRSVPFPLNSLTTTPRLPSDAALDAFSIDVSLLEGHEVPSMCPGAKKNMGSDMYGQDRLKDHPHVVTRTHLRIVRESRLYNKTAFQEKHEKLRKSSCGQLRDDTRGFPQLRYCRRWYMTHANYETLVQLIVPDLAAEGGLREESVYAPYMDVLASAVGPKDVVPVPIDREHCGADALNPANLTLADSMNITWHVSYSSVSPKMFMLGEMQLTDRVRSRYNDSEYKRASQHDTAEVYGSILGHRYHENSHPRWRLARLLLHTLGSGLLFLLHCRYWATRTSIVGISVPGTLAVAASRLIDEARFMSTPGVWAPLSEVQGVLEKMAMLAYFVMVRGLPLSLLMLKAVARVRVVWVGGGAGWGPRLRWAKATHQERASARLDARTSWCWPCAVLRTAYACARDLTLAFIPQIFAVVLFTLYTLQEQYLVAPIVPLHTPADFPDASLLDLSTAALTMTGLIMQLILNYRGKLFAGRYKVAVVLVIAVRVLRHAAALRWLVGQAEVMPGILYASLGWDVILAGYCWQAWWYSSSILDDEHGEEKS
ncbi:hypothetical protein C8R43DRAFT_1077079 [Mycena crocata]|nr:hypothetical protein C8R43DRAFT_1077079 [Mycena crocata]